MFKKLLISTLIAVSPLAALASTNITHLTLDGKTNVTVSEGESVEAKVTYDITSNDDVESLSWELVGSGIPKVCKDIPDHLVSGSFNASFTIDTVGASQGTWDPKVSLYGTNDEGANQNCEGSGDDTMTFSDRITVDDSDDSTSGSNDAAPAWLSAIMAQFNALLAALNNANTPTVPTTPVPTSLCSQIPYETSALQGFLMSHGQAGPFNAIGVYMPTGFRGPVTESALWNFKMQNNCVL